MLAGVYYVDGDMCGGDRHGRLGRWLVAVPYSDSVKHYCLQYTMMAVYVKLLGSRHTSYPFAPSRQIVSCLSQPGVYAITELLEPRMQSRHSPFNGLFGLGRECV